MSIGFAYVWFYKGFMRGFRYQSSLRRSCLWPLADETAPWHTQEKTSGTQGRLTFDTALDHDVSFTKTWKPLPLSLIFWIGKPTWEEPNILQMAKRWVSPPKRFVSSFDLCSYCSRVTATFADEISTPVKIQLGVRSWNNVSSINSFFIAFL